jgi:hypothetical protein
MSLSVSVRDSESLTKLEDLEKFNKREAVICRRGAVPLCLFRLRKQWLVESPPSRPPPFQDATAARGADTQHLGPVRSVKTSHAVRNYCTNAKRQRERGGGN